MATANAEAQRRWRQKQKQKRKDSLRTREANGLIHFYEEPFFKAIERDANWSDAEIALDCAGYDAPLFEDDSGPKSASGEIEQGYDDAEEPHFGGACTSLERAEIMVGCFIDAAATLARIINQYKRGEIAQRLKELEALDMSNPEERKQILSDIMTLTRALEELNKKTRWTFDQWRLEIEHTDEV
ncbi:hypothetical protein [Sulfitobacter mediterraneus]|uniref:hypothetical protein n=1 Tax=Sulfitobacter mediterraneus TaxID=83219 RepID=UPI0024939940|nr:hypothetical protein [Sulfitobacter mediterraneus]